MDSNQLVSWGGLIAIALTLGAPYLKSAALKVRDMFAKRENVDTLPDDVTGVNTLTRQLKHIVVEWPCEKCDQALPLIRQLEELAQ